MVRMLRALMRSLLATATRVASPIWETTRTSGRLRSTRLPTHGTASCTTGIRECSATTAIRRSGTLAVALGTDACDSRQCRLDSLLFDYLTIYLREPLI